jgi:hypothetical protein
MSIFTTTSPRCVDVDLAIVIEKQDVVWLRAAPEVLPLAAEQRFA